MSESSTMGGGERPAPVGGLGRGERAPDFVLPVEDGRPTRFYGLAGGRPAVIVFHPGAHEAMAERLAEVIGETADLFVVTARPGPRRVGTDGLAIGGTVPGKARRWRTFHDPSGRLAEGYRVGGSERPFVFVLDPNLRILDAFPDTGSAEPDTPGPDTPASDTPARLHHILQSIPDPPAPLTVTTQAPVLFVPGVLEPRICRFLIELWETRGHVETGVEASVGARREDILEGRSKRRADHTVEDPELLALLTTTLGSRILPEVARAFCYRATRFEGFKIACYDAEKGGHFRPHRDNLSPSTAHRRFGLSLNLNTDYEGGALRFPEYGDHQYRPGEGEALVFSGALLHEALPVTRGRRFVLLSFLFGEEGRSAGTRSG